MLASFLFQVKDHRREQGRRYQLGHILLFSIFAVLSNATSYRKIEVFIKENYSALNETFGLNWKRTPAHTTIRNMVQETSSDELEASFRRYSDALDTSSPERRFVAFDGKVLRGSFDHFRDQKAAQILSAFLTDSRIILAHEEIAEKTNEIPTAQELMVRLGLSGCIFTFDAINCQEKTLQVAKETDNEVIVQVKENQKTLFDDCQTTADGLAPIEVYQEPPTKLHNRIESRRVSVFAPMLIRDPIKWQWVKVIIKVERKRRVFNTKAKRWKQSDETSFYIATVICSAETFCHAIRQHWGIENSNHYVRDVTMGEDRSRIRTNPHLFARLRSFALNVLNANHVENASLELYRNSLNLDNVLNYVGIK
jgi:predicted transposase YbfD/YdcC